MSYWNKPLFNRLSSALVLVICLFFSCQKEPIAVMESGNYGVFIGLSPKDSHRLSNFNTVVIEADPYEKDDSFSASDIEKLHNTGKDVYSYLNVGAIENYRAYYNSLDQYALGPYENWEDEQWLDLRIESCRRFIIDSLAAEIAEKGVDGLFLDNIDVYYHYPSPQMFDAIEDILCSIHKMGLKTIINGGDTFVSKALAEGKQSLFDGINQECVFSRIKDYKKGVFASQSKEEKEYFLQYLSSCSSYGLKVYLLEYTLNKKLIKEIKSFCTANSFELYISGNLDLNGL